MRELLKIYKKELEEIMKKYYPEIKNNSLSEITDLLVIIPLMINILENDSSSSQRSSIQLPFTFRSCRHYELMDISSLKINDPLIENGEYGNSLAAIPNKLKDSITAYCSICKIFKNISEVYVDENIYRILGSLNKAKIPKFLAFTKEDFLNDTFHIEDCLRYDGESSTSATNLHSTLTFDSKLFILEVTSIHILLRKDIGVTLALRTNLKKGIELPDILLHKVPHFLMTINSFVNNKDLHDLFGQNSCFNYKDFDILYTDYKSSKGNKKLTSPSIEPLLLAFSMACYIVIGFCSLCLVDEDKIKDFILAYSYLKRMINVEEFNIYIIIFVNSKNDLKKELEKEQYRTFLNEVKSPYRIVQNIEKQKNIIMEEVNSFQNIFFANTANPIPQISNQKLVEYIHKRIKSVECFEKFLGKANSDFSVKDIISHKNNLQIIFKRVTEEVQAHQKNPKRIDNYHAFKPSCFPLVHSLEADCPPIFDRFTLRKLFENNQENQKYAANNENLNQSNMGQNNEINTYPNNQEFNDGDIDSFRNNYPRNRPLPRENDGGMDGKLHRMQNEEKKSQIKQLMKIDSLAFYFVINYDLIEHLENQTYLFFADEKMNINLLGIRFQNDTVKQFYTCYISKGLLKNLEIQNQPEANGLRSNLDQSIQEIIINSLFFFSSGAILDFNDECDFKIIKTILIKKASDPVFCSNQIFILIDESCLENLNLIHLRYSPLGQDNMGVNQGKVLFQQINIDDKREILIEVQAFLRNFNIVSDSLNIEYYDKTISFSGNEIKIRLVFIRSLGIWFSTYSSEVPKEAAFEALKDYIFRKEIGIKSFQLIPQIKASIEQALNLHESTEKDKGMFQISVIKLIQDHVFGVKYEIKIEPTRIKQI